MISLLLNNSTIDIDTGCRVWTGDTTYNGYGRVYYEGQLWQVHRLAWTLEHGLIPEGILILHSCDNPPCFEVSHLFSGNQSTNIKDAVSKGRHKSNWIFAHQYRSLQTHCDKGHIYTNKNTYIMPNGNRRCKECKAAWARKDYERKKVINGY
mgnify:CR=1 FL=1